MAISSPKCSSVAALSAAFVVVSDNISLIEQSTDNRIARHAVGISAISQHDPMTQHGHRHSTYVVRQDMIAAHQPGAGLRRAGQHDRPARAGRAGEMLADAVEQAKKEVPTIVRTVCIDQAMNGDPSMAEIAGEGASLPVPDIAHDPYRFSGILGTGGTTGKSKGVVLHDLAWETMISTGWHMMPFEGRPVHLLVAPMTHAAGVFNLMLMPQGCKTIALQKMDPLAVMQAIEKHKVTHLFLPPTALYALLAHPDVRKYDYSSMRYFLLAAAPVSPDKFKEAYEVFGDCMCQSWGQAEAPMFLTWLSPEEVKAAATNGNLSHRLTSCGQITMLSRVGVIDDDGNELPQGETGELAMQGNLRMTGYYKNEGATGEIRTANGWQRTGDMGYQDEDGFVYIVDRKKDMIISGGFNVYSVEVEKAVNSHPAVEDCAVFGVPHEKWGEMVKAVVQLKSGQSVSEEDLIAHCKDKIGSVMAPKTIDFMEALPRSPVGKVLKRDLRAPYWQGAGRGVN